MNFIIPILLKLEAYEKRFKQIFKYNGILKYENRKLKEELRKRKNIIDFLISENLERSNEMSKMYVEIGEERDEYKEAELRAERLSDEIEEMLAGEDI